MDVKKTQTQPVASSSTKDRDKEAALKAWKPHEFVGEVKEEFKKITWTSPEELKVYTQIVVGATLVFGMGIYALDLSIQAFLNGLAFIVKLIAG